MPASLDLYALYRLSMDRPLSRSEHEQLEQWREKFPFFVLSQVIPAKGVEGEDLEADRQQACFKAAIYAPDRRKLQQYLRGRLFWPRSVPEPDMEEKRSPKPPQVAETPEFDFSTPLFKALDWSGLKVQPIEHLSAFQLAQTAPRGQAYLQQVIAEKLLLTQHLSEQVRTQLADFKKSYQAPTIEPKLLPRSYFEENQKLRRQRRAKLIDQFLADAPKMTRPTPQTGEGERGEHAQALASTQVDDNLVTETLAKLVLKQGNPAEAIRIYGKLRLRFPHKSAYFDAQIEKISKS